MVAKDVVIVGAAHRSGGVPRGKKNVKGYVRGFDVRTGKRLWIFHTIPMPDEYGAETWEGDSLAYTGNTGVWGQISVDEELETVYFPVELPTGDYYGGHGLVTDFSAKVLSQSICTQAHASGITNWCTMVIWDMDIPCAPILADITIDGRTIKAVAQPTKQAFLYVFRSRHR